ncbi:MAG: molybdopterin-dependent oxidoreductase [Desulfobaccales bacterium]
MDESRRKLIQGALALGALAATGGCMGSSEKPARWISGAPDVDPVSGPKVKFVRTICLGCHSACGLQCKVADGVLVKIDGNPYHPNVMEPHLSYKTDPKEAERVNGTVCAKGGATLQTLYDPFRLQHPVKRVGPRGSGQWKTITWDQVYEEIIKGGDLFGEGHVDGLAACRDLQTPIDPEAPELGPKVNQVVFMPGRIEHGKKEFTDRFFRDAYGTVNFRLDHTAICETSHHVGTKLCTDGSAHFKPDIMSARYIIFFGTTPYEANFPMQALARKLNFFRERGGKLVIVDPRFSNSAAKASEWIPVLPGTDAAFALGMMRWMMDHDRVDKRYLAFPNQKAAEADGHLTWCNATFLVRQDNRKLMLPGDAKITGDDKGFVVWKEGAPHDNRTVASADLEYTGTVAGIPVKTVYTMLKERVGERTVKQYAEICGLDPAIIERTAADFTSFGRQAVADFYRGAVQHTNGTYNARTLANLNFLIGNVSWKGGCEAHGGSHWHEMGGQPGNPYNLAKLHPGKVKPTGVPVDRNKHNYEESTEFKKNGYPAKRPWYPFAFDYVYHEVFPSIGAKYPYQTKILITYWNNVVYAAPAGTKLAAAVKDPKILPLFIAIDPLMGETSSLADYILPTRHFLEDYATEHVAPTILTTTSAVRVPVVEPVHKDSKLLEEICIDLAARMGLPGFGKDGFGPGDPLLTPWDWYKKLFANIAYGDKENDAVPGATEADKLKYIMDRGGRFEDYSKAYKGDHTNHSYKKSCLIYNEKLATTRNSMTGEYFDGLPYYEPIRDSLGRPVVRDEQKYPFRLNTYHPVYHAQARTAAAPWLMEITPEEWVQINAGDAAKLGIKNSDLVVVFSQDNPEGVKAKALVTEGMRPGIVTIPHSLGRWEYGAKSFKLDGQGTPVRKWIARGCSANPVMTVDSHLKDVCMTDPIGGSASFYDSRVGIRKA